MSTVGVVQPNTTSKAQQQHRQETINPQNNLTTASRQQSTSRQNQRAPQQPQLHQSQVQSHQGHLNQAILPPQYQHHNVQHHLTSPYLSNAQNPMSKRMDTFDPSQLGYGQQPLGHMGNNPYGQQQAQQQQQMSPEHLTGSAARKRRLQAPLIPPQQQQNVQTSLPGMMPQPQTLIPGDEQQGGQGIAQMGALGQNIGGAQQGVGQQQQQMQLPPAKKSRTNTPWTAAEEQRLKQLREAGSNWAEIAKTFPNRTEGSVKKHWYKDMHYAEFAEDESQALLNAIKEYETNKWKVIGLKVGKPAKACEQYAKEHFGTGATSKT